MYNLFEVNVNCLAGQDVAVQSSFLPPPVPFSASKELTLLLPFRMFESLEFVSFAFSIS